MKYILNYDYDANFLDVYQRNVIQKLSLWSSLIDIGLFFLYLSKLFALLSSDVVILFSYMSLHHYII